MIRIRSGEGVVEPTLIGVEATLTTENAVYTLSSHQSLLDDSSPLAGGLFGSIAWPRIRFRISDRVVLEQQFFLPDQGSAAAFSWHLCHNSSALVRLQIKPFFVGCPKPSYRDVGFRAQSAEEGGRLIWLPSVLGPTIIADTNGIYRDDASANDLVSSEKLVTPGAFMFTLTDRPSVLILTDNRLGASHDGALIGAFLAGLIPKNIRSDDAAAECQNITTSPSQSIHTLGSTRLPNSVLP